MTVTTEMLAIGQTAYAAVENAYCEKRITCTDCFGQRALTVILGDGSQVSIACAGCEAGYLGSTGEMRIHTYEANVQTGVVTAIEAGRDGEGFRYSMNGWRAEFIFATVEEARAKVAEMYAAHEVEEAAKPTQKVKPARAWAWHVTYHRGEIKRAEKSIEYHKAALAVAKQKAQIRVPEETSQ